MATRPVLTGARGGVGGGSIQSSSCIFSPDMV